MTPRCAAPFVVFALLASCASDGDADDAPPTDAASGGEETATSAPTERETGGETEADGTEAAVDTETTTEAEITVEASRYIGLAAQVSIATATPVQVEVTATAGDHVVEVPRTAAHEAQHDIPLVGMRPEQTYAISARLFDGSGTQVGEVGGAEFTTEALPEWFDEHELTIDPDRASPGYTIVEFEAGQVAEGAPSAQHLMAFDDEGEVVWYYTNTGALSAVEPTPAGTFNMVYWPFGIREVDILGNVVANWRILANGADPDSISNEAVFEGIDPDQVDRQGGLGALLGNPGDADPVGIVAPWIELSTLHHEAWPMPNGNVLTLSTTVHELTPAQREAFCPDDPLPFDAISDVVVEFEPDGRVVRTWDLWDVIDIDDTPGSELCVPGGLFAEENTRDWNHANSVIYDPERDAIIVSSRHTNQIVALDHLDEEGPQSQLRWIIGDGATLPLDGEPTYFQHAVEVNDDGSITVYDNGNFRPGTSPDDPDNLPFSRAVIYDVDDGADDPADWSVSQRWENIDTVDGVPVYSSFISDADVLENGNVLVTHGGVGTFPPTPEDPLRVLIREIVPEGDSGGDVVWELNSTPGVAYSAYRSERIPSFYFGPEWTS